MKHPISVTVDPDWHVASVIYFDERRSDGSLPLFRDPDGVVRVYTFDEKNYGDSGVVVHLTPDDDILGFEILDIRSEASVAVARDFAADNDLAFPEDLRAAAAARTPAA